MTMNQPRTIVRAMKPRCRHCGRQLKLGEVIDELLLRIAQKLATGERVELPGLGVLRPDQVPERWIKTIPHGERKLVPGWVQVRFRAAEKLRAIVNKERDEARADVLAAKKKAKEARDAKRPGTPASRRHSGKRRRAQAGKDRG